MEEGRTAGGGGLVVELWEGSALLVAGEEDSMFVLGRL